MTPTRLRKAAADADDFNRQADEFATLGRSLQVRRDLMVQGFRDMGMLVAEAEEMCATLSFKITMPAPEPADLAANDTAPEPVKMGDAA
jgi:hypothetical protein